MASSPGPPMLSALKAASHVLYASPPWRCPAFWVEVPTRRRRALSQRIYNCRGGPRCHKQVHICSICDRGNIYCENCTAAREKRLESGRRRSQRYQKTRKGQLKHAARMTRYRRRQRLLRLPDFGAILLDIGCQAKHRRSQRRRCQRGHHHRPRRQRECSKRMPAHRARCPRARRPQERCQRPEHPRPDRPANSGRQRPVSRCQRVRRRPTRCRPVRRAHCVDTADPQQIVTHGGSASTELGLKKSGTIPASKESTDENKTPPESSRSRPPVDHCEFCKRALPPFTRLSTWRGSG